MIHVQAKKDVSETIEWWASYRQSCMISMIGAAKQISTTVPRLTLPILPCLQ
jgi:hypothetical protein